jgi:hypothetical protein
MEHKIVARGFYRLISVYRYQAGQSPIGLAGAWPGLFGVASVAGNRRILFCLFSANTAEQQIADLSDLFEVGVGVLFMFCCTWGTPKLALEYRQQCAFEGGW